MRKIIPYFFLLFSIALASLPCHSKSPVEGDFVIHNFPFQSGETTLPDLRLHYATIGQLRKNSKGKIINADRVGSWIPPNTL